MSDPDEITVVMAPFARNSRPKTRDPAPCAPGGAPFSRLNLASCTIGSLANRFAVSQTIVRTRLPAMRSIVAPNAAFRSRAAARVTAAAGRGSPQPAAPSP